MLLGVVGDSLPQQAEDDEIAVLAMHTGSAQLNHLVAQRLEGIEFKFLRAVISEIRLGIVAGLQTVCANDLSRGQVLHDEMVANRIKPILIQAREVRLLKAFVKFKVEDLKAQGLRGANLV